jgi:hypothetical protein
MTHINERRAQHPDRSNHAKEQENDVGSLSAETGLDELRAHCLLADPLGQFEFLHHRPHVFLGRCPQARLFAAREAFALALADLLALRRHRCHALFERVAAEQRHGEGNDRRAGGDRGEDHRHQALVFEYGVQEVEHATLRN